MSAVDEHEFLRDVREHQMTVLRDEGLFRHLRFKRPSTGCMHFDLITWPGYLCYTGDMGTYVFSRLSDMFEFFRTDREYAHRRGRQLSISLSYWAEKLQAIDKGDGYEEFDVERFRAVVCEYRTRWMRELKTRGASKDARRELWEAVEDEVLRFADDGEAAALGQAYEFAHRVGDHEFQFSDLCDHRFSKFTRRFTWCCYALAWGIQQYDDAKTAETCSEAQ